MTAQRAARSDPSFPGDLGPGDRSIAVQDDAQRQAPFSYRCNGCGRCCYHNRIQLNPYEIARLARNRGMDSGEFLSAYTDAGGSVLTQQAGGACVFLRAGGCSVHPDRPLVCRLYPLGRLGERDGTETFFHVEPHPETEGEYGEDGTVADFLDQQQAAPFLAAADRYFALFHDVVALLRRRLGERPSDVPDVMASLDQPGGDGEPVAWYDIDRIVADHAAGTGAPRPSSPEDKMTTHIEALRTWASLPDEEKTHAHRKNVSKGKGRSASRDALHHTLRLSALAGALGAGLGVDVPAAVAADPTVKPGAKIGLPTVSTPGQPQQI